MKLAHTEFNSEKQTEDVLPGARKTFVQVVFLIIALLLGYFYLRQPLRRKDVVWIKQKFRILESLSLPIPIAIFPNDWSKVGLEEQAEFGEGLSFLGCDLAVSRDKTGTHLWQITMWRALKQMEHDYAITVRLFRRNSNSSVAQADHLLGQQFIGDPIPTSRWPLGKIMTDAVILPDFVQDLSKFERHIDVQGPGKIKLTVKTRLLEKEGDSGLVICQ